MHGQKILDDFLSARREATQDLSVRRESEVAKSFSSHHSKFRESPYTDSDSTILQRLKINTLIPVPKTIASLLGFDFIPSPTRSHFF